MDFFSFFFFFFPVWFVSTVSKCTHQLIAGETSIQLKKDCKDIFLICRDDELEETCTLAAAGEDNEEKGIPCCCYDYSAAQFEPALKPAQEAPQWWLGMEMLTNNMRKCLSLSVSLVFTLPASTGALLKLHCWPCSETYHVDDVADRNSSALVTYDAVFPSVPAQLQPSFMLVTPTTPPKSRCEGCGASLCSSLCHCVSAGGLILALLTSFLPADISDGGTVLRLSLGTQSGSDSSPLLYIYIYKCTGPARCLQGVTHFTSPSSRELVWHAPATRQTSPWQEGEEVDFALHSAREATARSCVFS